jgi:hypothetical protein
MIIHSVARLDDVVFGAGRIGESFNPICAGVNRTHRRRLGTVLTNG